MADPVLHFEAGQTPAGYVKLTDSGDRTVFNSAVALWSKRSGYAPVVRPNGIIAGGAVTVADSGSDNVVDVAALTCYLEGIETTVAADADFAIARPTVSNYQKHSITVTDAGALALVEGAEGGSFSTTRAAAGGPPLIPVGSVEVAQVWLSSQSDGVITADEIKQIVGTHKEMYNNPVWTEYPYKVTAGVAGYAGVTMASALPAIHTGAVGKEIWVSYAVPDFAAIQISKDFVRPAESVSVNSTDFYGLSVGSISRSLAAGSFTSRCPSGLADPLLALEGESIFFKLFPDRLSEPYMLCQGYLGIKETVDVDGTIEVAATIGAELAGERVLS